MDAKHAGGQFAAAFVNARRQRLEVVPVFDPRTLGDFLQAFAVEADEIRQNYRVVVISGQLGRGVSASMSTSLSTSTPTFVTISLATFAMTSRLSQPHLARARNRARRLADTRSF